MLPARPLIPYRRLSLADVGYGALIGSISGVGKPKNR